MPSTLTFKRSALSLLAAALAAPLATFAAPLTLSTAPAGTKFKPAAPNVIVSVDDSGSMGLSGMATLRDALRDTFSATNVPDGEIRLAWQAMSGCFRIPSGDDCKNENELRVLDAAQRRRFMTWVDTLTVRSGTPSHRMLFNAGEYLKSEPGVNSPWASVPGVRQEPMLSCRKAYNLFMTDGGWNSPFGNGNGGPNDLTPWNDSNPVAASTIGNADGTRRTLGDGSTVYDPTKDETRVYRDSFGSALFPSVHGTAPLPTLSDLAFHYWATDLQPTMANSVAPKVVRKGDQSFTSGSAATTLPEFWNPRNDPATWQHMTTYTVGFNAAANWNGTAAMPKFGTDTWTGDSYEGLVTGTAAWTDAITANEMTRMPELWHMALNSRGKFVPAPTATSLSAAFKDILNDIQADKSTPITSVAGSSSSSRVGSSLFASSYTGTDWSGQVRGFAVNAGATTVTEGLWGQTVATSGSPAVPHTTATLMDAESADWPSQRLVLSSKTTSAGAGASSTVGIAWSWDNLSPGQQTALATVDGVLDTSPTAVATAQSRLSYLRGDRTLEQGHTPAGPFRTRGSRHGDIVNSQIWYTAGRPAAGYGQDGYTTFRADNATRASMVYVGANDGMLHGFDAATGRELMAYVPEGVHSALPQLTKPNYQHRYFVDGSPFTADIYTGASTKWRTYLAGFPGMGGKGYFVLDVTTPSTFSTTAASELVVLDKTAGALDADIGHITGAPARERGNTSITRQITKMNNGRWALVIGNGYNSSSEKAVLLIQYLDAGKELIKITADGTGGNGNGLSTPRLVDLNGDNTPDAVYAGDLRGNLWKFDLSSTNASQWSVAFAGAPLFVAQDGAQTAQRQPIATAPLWVAHPDGGLMIVFATGKNLTDADRSDTSRQTIYGVYDKFSSPSAITGGRTVLTEQTVSGASTATTTDSQSALWTVSANAVDYTGPPPRRGWFLDLPLSRERAIDNPAWFAGDLVDIASLIPGQGVANPDEETCEAPTVASRRYLTTLNAISGARPDSRIYAYTETGDSRSRIETALSVELRSKDGNTETGVRPDAKPSTVRTPPKRVSLYPSWRQLQ